MKKILNWFLIVLIILEVFLPAVKAHALASEMEEFKESLKYDENAQYVPTGTLEVDFKLVYPIANVENPNFKVRLSTKDNTGEFSFNGIETMENLIFDFGSKKKTVSIRKMDENGSVLNGTDKESRIVYYALTFYDLEKDNYTLQIEGAGYKSLEVSNIQINEYSKRLTFTNEQGGFQPGDVNGDNLVNEKDLESFLSLYHQNYSLSRDFNRDGIVDITDFTYLSMSLKGEVTSYKLVDTNAILDTSKANLSGNVEGTLDDLLMDQFNVLVKPQDETKEINDENKALLELSFKEKILSSQIRIGVGLDNIPEEFNLIVTDEFGKKTVIPGNYTELKEVHQFTDKATSDTIVIDLKGQIAIKKVTIEITKTSTNKLAEIAKVEFLNNVYEEVPTPIIEVPRNIKTQALSERVIVDFQNLPNVTGYEILVQEMNGDNVVKNTIYQTSYNHYEIKNLKNYTTYKISVRAVNEEWKGNYSDSISVIPIPNGYPPKVDMLVLNSVYAGFNISYKKMKDATFYYIYYREKGSKDFLRITNETTSYQLRNLKPGVEYEFYVSGVNEHGEGPRSDMATGKTKEYTMPDTPNYKLLNTPNGVGVPTNHIFGVSYVSNNNNAGTFDLVDNSYETYWQSNSWDTGGFNELNAGPIFTFDNVYQMNQILFVPKDDIASFMYVKINYWDKDGNRKRMNASIKSLTSKNGQKYYQILFQEPVESNKIQINLANYVATGNNAIREIKFYYYDSLEDDVASLFQDDLRVELKENVTKDILNELENRVNTRDSYSGEFHPNRDIILRDIVYAKSILNDKEIQDVITVDNNVTNSLNGHLGFAMSLSDLQPLGISVRSKDKISLYVGTKGNVLPQLVFTQFYAEANVWKQVTVNLVKGQNIIEVPQIGSTATERGGSVYIRMPRYSNQEVKVRVSGGTKIPVLDIHGLKDETEIKEKIKRYVEEIRLYVENLPNVYQKENLIFDKNTSVLNTTEIVTNNGLFSVAATAVVSSFKNTIEETINQLYRSFTAFEEMMDLFYRHKGLSNNTENSKDKLPSSRINIRYMKMFAGAFMYAGGEHIGIGYGSIAGLMQGRPNEFVDGVWKTTGFFGWGISHEIGHQINQGKLAYAEVTNNVYSLLAQTNDDISLSRIEPMYDKIYDKVTSGTIGKSSNVFVSLAMYWQLHLAYDKELTFTDENSIYAKINRLTRTLNLKGNTDNLLVMYASTAIQKDLTEFFQKWGIEVSEETKDYVSQFPKEERAIWYLNDGARRKNLNSVRSFDENTTVIAKFTEQDTQNKKYSMELSITNPEALLGYEIIRNGKVVGFTTENQFTDVIGALNNQALSYEVVAYDNYLNKTKVVTLPEVKVSYDGSISKYNFDITSNFKNTDDVIDYENPEFNPSETSVYQFIDGKLETAFIGEKRIQENSKDNANIIIHLNDKLAISGIRYAGIKDSNNNISNYKVYVSSDNVNWTLAKEGKFDLNEVNDYTNLIYFNKEGTNGGNQLWTYQDVSYIKIEAVGNKNGITGREIDVISPPGDNVDASRNDIGILENDYHYIDGNGNNAVIQKGSIVFTGSYRGNPAFNVVLLADAQNNSLIYDGENFLFAKLNSDNEVYEIASGTWFYVMSQEQYEKIIGKNVRAYLYRVNNAETNEGQRLTSTSFEVKDLPDYEALPYLQIKDTEGE